MITINHLTIIGNLTADPESRNVGDKNVCNFTVAVNRRQRKQDGTNEADFFRVSAWGKTGESCQKYLTKGKKVCVTGSVSVNTYQSQDGSTRASMNVFANDVVFLSPLGQSSDGQGQSQGGFAAVETDELPFDRGLAYP